MAAQCSLIIPTYNAEAFIQATASRLGEFVRDNPEWCVLYVCDGCTDRTVELLNQAIPADETQIRVETYVENRGKGYAVRRGLSMANTPFLFFTDADLAYAPEEALKLHRLLQNGADMAVVNRASPESCFLISPRDFPTIYKRHLMSRAFNWWLRQMLPITILDTQAGLKGMTAAAWERIGPQMTTDGFFLDVELLARAGKAGMRIDESPVVFRYVDPTTVRMISHGWSMIFDTLKLRKALKKLDAQGHQTIAGAVI